MLLNVVNFARKSNGQKISPAAIAGPEILLNFWVPTYGRFQFNTAERNRTAQFHSAVLERIHQYGCQFLNDYILAGKLRKTHTCRISVQSQRRQAKPLGHRILLQRFLQILELSHSRDENCSWVIIKHTSLDSLVNSEHVGSLTLSTKSASQR